MQNGFSLLIRDIYGVENLENTIPLINLLTLDVEVYRVGGGVALDVADGAGVVALPRPAHPLQNQGLTAQDNALLHILLQRHILGETIEVI
jgi:hypothetical protein